jgi:hypothetical protein
MDTMREGSPKFTRRSFLKKSLLGTGALALSQVPFGRTVHAATGPVTLTYWHGWTGEWEKMVQYVVEMYHAEQGADQPGGRSMGPVHPKTDRGNRGG